jgi:pimeloyl-ACP methyl ester carboxylesterase
MHLPEGWETGHVDANGVGLQYYRVGSGPPLVYAHGFFANGRCPRRLVEDLAETHEVVTYDARAHGRSAAPDSGYAMADRVADLVGLLAALGLENSLLLGHSMGGATVAATAAEHPDRVSGAILEDPAGFGWEPPMGPEERVERARSDVADWAERGVDAMERERAHDLGAERVREVPDQPRREAVGMVECRPEVAEIAREGYPDVGYPDLFPAIEVPTLVLRSDANPDQRRRDLDAAEALPNGRLVHVPGAEHHVVGSQRDAAMAEIRTFLRRF